MLNDQTNQTNPSAEPHADVFVRRQVSCDLPSHTFTADTYSGVVAPALDLIPGRRCICGYLVIIDHPGPALSRNMMLAVPIDSALAMKFAHDHSELKKW